jgi:hypothetical protein
VKSHTARAVGRTPAAERVARAGWARDPRHLVAGAAAIHPPVRFDLSDITKIAFPVSVFVCGNSRFSRVYRVFCCLIASAGSGVLHDSRS